MATIFRVLCVLYQRRESRQGGRRGRDNNCLRFDYENNLQSMIVPLLRIFLPVYSSRSKSPSTQSALASQYTAAAAHGGRRTGRPDAPSQPHESTIHLRRHSTSTREHYHMFHASSTAGIDFSHFFLGGNLIDSEFGPKAPRTPAGMFANFKIRLVHRGSNRILL